MGEAALWGLLGASSLIVGAEVAFRAALSRFTVGLILAFGAGALVSSVSFELVAPALEAADSWLVAAGFAAGALVFFGGDWLIDRSAGADPEEDSGLGIALGTVLDGIPESAVLGMSLVGGGSVSLALLVGVWISNFPESLGSSRELERSGRSRRWIRALWLGIVAVSALAAAVGFAIVEASSSRTGALVEAFAAGAVLTMMADEMMPKAFGGSRTYAGLATAAGFGLAVGLSRFE
jgi:ZIP family zinc transporter